MRKSDKSISSPTESLAPQGAGSHMGKRPTRAPLNSRSKRSDSNAIRQTHRAGRQPSNELRPGGNEQAAGGDQGRERRDPTDPRAAHRGGQAPDHGRLLPLAVVAGSDGGGLRN